MSMSSSRTACRTYARNAERLRSQILGLPKRRVGALPRCSAQATSHNLAVELSQKLPAAALATLVASLSVADVAAAVDFAPPPTQQTQQVQQLDFQQSASLTAPDIKASGEYQLPEGTQWRYSDFIIAVENGKVERVRFSKDGSQLQLTAVDGRRAAVVLPNDPELVDILARNGVDISVSEGDQQGNYVALLGNILFPLIAFGGLFFLFRRAQNGQPGGGPMNPMGGPMEFGRSKSKFQEVPETGVTFEDVAGCDGAKLELVEIVDFLKNPDKYTALGAKIPKGCLLVGPPGTGKTLLAKAVAGEAGTPFFSCAASEFVELFVGVGASRVRDLFEKAKAKAPCIIFIDEIDAIGTKRFDSELSGDREVQRTMLELLNQLDGFSSQEDVKVIAATNRADILDPALMRSGRLDRKVEFPHPNEDARAKILRIHSRKMNVSGDVNFEEIARSTDDFNAAQLKAVCVEAGMLALRRDGTEVNHEDFVEGVTAVQAKKKANLNYYA
mmetsp:Transcript_27206/g.59433  ORF Transcript_27206/g.59433 Transcript_27206/m.59433 type:complete len:501 (+) Transcript_27206:147-1649(+)